MKTIRKFEFPEPQQKIYSHAKKIQYWTIIYVISVVTIMALVLGKSQAMKTAWIDDILSIIPPIVFFVAARFNNRPANKEFPYGFHRANTIAYVVGASALLSLGIYLVVDSFIKLIEAEHPTIGAVKIFNANIWLGWLMIAALVWSTVPAIYLGRIKLKPADQLHDKILFNDADMNKASWETALAAIVGIIGIGYGIWWADAVAALLISLNILYDGYTNLKAAVTDLMNRIPRTVNYKKTDYLVFALEDFFRDMDWIKDVSVRLREEGHVIFGEVFIIPENNATGLIEKIEQAQKNAYDFNWRILDLVIMPVSSLPGNAEPSGGVLPSEGN